MKNKHFLVILIFLISCWQCGLNSNDKKLFNKVYLDLNRNIIYLSNNDFYIKDYVIALSEEVDSCHIYNGENLNQKCIYLDSITQKKCKLNFRELIRKNDRISIAIHVYYKDETINRDYFIAKSTWNNLESGLFELEEIRD